MKPILSQTHPMIIEREREREFQLPDAERVRLTLMASNKERLDLMAFIT